eukprot:16356081-Heterocapsa_arctica.AAC.1
MAAALTKIQARLNPYRNFKKKFMNRVEAPPAAGAGRSAAARGTAVGAIGAAAVVKGRKQGEVEGGVSLADEIKISNPHPKDEPQVRQDIGAARLPLWQSTA